MIMSQLKKVLRERIKTALSGMTKEQREIQSACVAEKLFKLPVYQKAQRVSVYLSTERELDTMTIIKDLFRQGKEIFVPTYRKNDMEMVQLYSLEDYDSLPLTKWHIKQPNFEENRPNAMTKGLDLIILPGVAFTRCGNRLGHGMGYYDKFLKKFFEQHDKTKTALIGVAFKEQIVEMGDLPMEAHDEKLDQVLTSD
ncbi:5-formyltetrahydrofolate cyclo-ligase [Culicoides brevitarsis]|uniref:5-formyltetrahydrofolate cyclo-ligase n=1 Tax=Culicoides brevitarsis TaxID=469753 RepID=UPI00307B8F37